MEHDEKRTLTLGEKKQRGCVYCKHVEHGKYGGCNRLFCPFDRCPYKVLDKYETYEEFMASEDSKILVGAFFQTAASCYELSNGNMQVRKMFSDGHDLKL